MLRPAIIFLILTIPAAMAYAPGSQVTDKFFAAPWTMAESIQNLPSVNEMTHTLPSVTVTSSAASLVHRAETGLRQALAVMATRQWSGGWANASTLDGLIVQGQSRPPIPYYWLTVQPPATPGIAGIYVRAAEVLNDDSYLHHARLAQRALLAVQTKGGGFPKEAAPSSPPSDTGTFDDEVTTGALDFFIDLWKLTGDESDRQAVLSIGEFLLESQYSGSGGWPQVYPPNPDHYNRYITFNDRAMTNVITSLLKLYELFGDSRYLEAARRGGECIIQMQGPPGEEIWGQQHDPETLLPAPARSFEPAAYTAYESSYVIEALLELYLATGEERFMEPVPKAFAWYESNRLPNGHWARFYEPATGKPIYGDHDGKVYYRLEDISLERQSGYGWEGDFYPHTARKIYDRIRKIGRSAYLAEQQQASPGDGSESAPEVEEVLEAQHPDGWWIDTVRGVGYFESGRVRASMLEAGAEEETYEMIRSGTFVRNAELLLDYIEAKKHFR